MKKTIATILLFSAVFASNSYSAIISMDEPELYPKGVKVTFTYEIGGYFDEVLGLMPWSQKGTWKKEVECVQTSEGISAHLTYKSVVNGQFIMIGEGKKTFKISKSKICSPEVAQEIIVNGIKVL